MNGVSSPGVLGSNMVYNSINLVESGSSGDGNLLGFPERPDQPECRYFMNTGTCKYGSECKYHHPKERIMQSAPNALGPLGLPSRPVRFSFVFFCLKRVTFYQLMTFFFSR